MHANKQSDCSDWQSRDHATYPLTFWHICSWTAQHLLGVGITPRLGIVTLVQSLVHEATNNTRNDEILLQVKLAQLTHKQSPNLSLAYLNLFRTCVSKPWRAYIRDSLAAHLRHASPYRLFYGPFIAPLFFIRTCGEDACRSMKQIIHLHNIF